MLPFLRAWTQEIVILIVLATVIDLALPSGVMKKYVDYTVSLALLLLLLGPVAVLLTGELDVTALQVGAIQRCGIGEVLLRPLSEQSTWLTYELLLEGRIAELAWTEPLVTAALVEVSLEREAASPHFAQPTHVLLTLTVKDGVLSTAYGEMLARLRGVLADRYDRSPAAITMQVR